MRYSVCSNRPSNAHVARKASGVYDVMLLNVLGNICKTRVCTIGNLVENSTIERKHFSYLVTKIYEMSIGPRGPNI